MATTKIEDDFTVDAEILTLFTMGNIKLIRNNTIHYGKYLRVASVALYSIIYCALRIPDYGLYLYVAREDEAFSEGIEYNLLPID